MQRCRHLVLVSLLLLLLPGSAHGLFNEELWQVLIAIVCSLPFLNLDCSDGTVTTTQPTPILPPTVAPSGPSPASPSASPSPSQPATALPSEGSHESPSESPSLGPTGFTLVRSDPVPDTTPLDGIYVPMSAEAGSRWDFMKTQYQEWFRLCAPTETQKRAPDCWRYDPMKTLYELARRGSLVGDPMPGALQDARDTTADFLERQYWGSSGTFPDCSGGVDDLDGVNKCDMKYWGHGSAAYYWQQVEGQPYPYSAQQVNLMKEYCYSQGWAAGFVNVNDLSDLYTERWTGLAIQCLIDFHKAGADVRAELNMALQYQHEMFTGNYSGAVIGAPMHSMNGHECSGYCDNLNYWMFSPWMGSSFLIPALWEYWVFVRHDPRVASMIVSYGEAMMKHGVVQPNVWTNGTRSANEWMLVQNPTEWLTLYFGNPYNREQAIGDQDQEGWYSDLHNAEAIFAFSAAYFFSCEQVFRDRVEEMWGFFNRENAIENDAPRRVFLWQHRGSASTEWLLENAACP